MTDYPLRITTENPIPDDVIVEHIAVALRDFKFAGKVDVQMARQHPFDGPEVFDDYVPAGMPEDPFPLTTQVIDKLKETRRHGND